MATTKLMIEDGRIVNYYDRYFHSLSENGKEYIGNGWVVTIKDGHKGRPGRIVCHSEREYSDGRAVCHREFKLADGMIGLSGGNVRSRYVYFRSEEFSKWLEKNELQCVIRSDPNGVYISSNPYGSVWSHGLAIKTDGEVDWEGRRYEVSSATFAIVRKHYCDGVSWHKEPGILYTEVKDVMSLF